MSPAIPIQKKAGSAQQGLSSQEAIKELDTQLAVSENQPSSLPIAAYTKAIKSQEDVNLPPNSASKKFKPQEVQFLPNTTHQWAKLGIAHSKQNNTPVRNRIQKETNPLKQQRDLL